MQPLLRSATLALRQSGSSAAAASSSSSGSKVAVAAAGTSSALGKWVARNGYATQAGQPMPPPPPGDSGKKATAAASKEQSPIDVNGQSGTPETPETTNVDALGSRSIASEAAEPPAVPPTPEEVLPIRSTGREIKPVSSLASQYLDATEIPASAAERTGARSTSGKRPMSSIEKRRRNLGRATLAAMAVGSGIFAWNLGREWESEKEKERLGRGVTIEDGLEGRWQRGQARFWDTLDVSRTFNLLAALLADCPSAVLQQASLGSFAA